MEPNIIKSLPESYSADPRSAIISDEALAVVQLMFTEVATPRDGQNLEQWQELSIRNGMVYYQPGADAKWQMTCITAEELKEFVERARALKPGEKEAIIDPQEQRELQRFFNIAQYKERCYQI